MPDPDQPDNTGANTTADVTTPGPPPEQPLAPTETPPEANEPVEATAETPKAPSLEAPRGRSARHREMEERPTRKVDGPGPPEPDPAE